MNGFSTILTLLSGVALFLFGMNLMGDGLKKVAGNKLELILYKLTSNPLKGILLGTAVTSVIQSSSATTVMVVGFVNSGMMKVAQAIGIIMGANIGTSITGWILCMSYIDGSSGIASILSTATISAVVAVIGIIMVMFVKKKIYNNIGSIMLGFSILMTGMQTMSGAVAPLKESETFVNALTKFENPFMGILMGIAFTAILQSASASVGILQALSVTGAITFASAFPITLGIGIGAACPVLLSAIGTSKNGKRTALVYLLNDLFGMIIWGSIFYICNAIFKFGFMDTVMNPVLIALLNTVYRMLTVLVLAPFIKYIEKLVFVLVKDSPEDLEDAADFDLLEERFLQYPPLAIEQSRQAVNSMAKKARKNITRAISLQFSFSPEKYKKVQEKEQSIDKYEDKLGTFLTRLIGFELSESQTLEVSKYLHTVSDFERLGDHACNIADNAAEMKEMKLEFSGEGRSELEIISSATDEIVSMTIDSFSENDIELAAKVEPLREWIGILCGEMKNRHIRRLSHGDCGAAVGHYFDDNLTNFARIAAHCSNIAAAVVETSEKDFDTHEYVHGVRDKRNEDYVALMEFYGNKYQLPKKKNKNK